MLKRLKQLWQILFPSNQPIAKDHSDRLLNLESETQSLRLTINEREQTIAQLRSELELQRQNESNNQAIAFQTQQEQVFSELAAPISQLLTQIYLLEIENKPVQAKDAIAIVKRMLRVFTEQGLTQVGNIGDVERSTSAHQIPCWQFGVKINKQGLPITSLIMDSFIHRGMKRFL
jgi:hypothetical protein